MAIGLCRFARALDDIFRYFLENIGCYLLLLGQAFHTNSRHYLVEDSDSSNDECVVV